MIRGLTLAFATVGFISSLPYKLVPHKKWKGGGLLGSLAGWGLLWLTAGPTPGAWAAFAFILAIAVASSHWAEKWLSYDDPRIVIDEVAGVWTACFFLPRAFVPMVLGLVFFRVFDVLKGPWGNAAARLPGGWGVVADDLVAGLISWGLTVLLLSFDFL